MQVKEIGKGSYGVAELMRDTLTGELVAVKFIERGEKVCRLYTCAGRGGRGWRACGIRLDRATACLCCTVRLRQARWARRGTQPTAAVELRERSGPGGSHSRALCTLLCLEASSHV